MALIIGVFFAKVGIRQHSWQYRRMNCCDLKPFAKPKNIYAVAYSLQIVGQQLNFGFRLRGQLEHLVIPPDLETFAKGESLFEHTCFEIFLAHDDGQYTEWNFSPSSEWAQYSFKAYRINSAMASISQPPKFEIRRDSDELILFGKLALSGATAVGVSAVVEDGDGILSYWATQHLKKKPDFHDAESFLPLTSMK